MSTAAATRNSKPVLHVEVRLKSLEENNASFIRTDLVSEEVSEWLVLNFHNLKIDQRIENYDGLAHHNVIESITAVDVSGKQNEVPIYPLEDVSLDVQAYEMHDVRGGEQSKPKNMNEDPDEEENASLARTMRLPNKALDGVWDALVFEDAMPAKLLRYLTRMMLIFRRSDISLNLLNWNRLLLLHGPPGSGKTSLSRAIAQKLTIRLGRYFTEGRLVELSCQSLLSKWFGESGKLVGKVFDNIQSLADEETYLICVLMDEVETLTAARERSASGHECGDAFRATNQLLTGLDRLRHRSNVIVICTSNLVTSIDSAFLDRVDLQQRVSNPSVKASYDIFRSILNELIRTNHVEFSSPFGDERNSEDADAAFSGTTDIDEVELRPLPSIPSYPEMNIHYYHDLNSPARKLWDIACRCEGVSGRTLRRLPVHALAFYTCGDTCSINEAIAALSLAVEEERRGMSQSNK